MSESVTEAVADAISPPEPVEPITTPVETIAEPAQQAEPVEAQPEPKPEAEKVSKRVASLTRKIGEEARRAEAAERRAEAAEALLRASRGEDDNTPSERTQAAPDVDQLRAEIRFSDRLSAIDVAGKKELGAAWDEAKETLGSLGATNMQNAKGRAFLEALAETENPTKVFAHFAEDTDALMDILSKPATTMAAKLTRLDMELSKPVAVRPLSSAPTPPAKVVPSGVLPVMDLYNYPSDLPMSEYAKLIDQQLPPHLGGRRKSA